VSGSITSTRKWSSCTCEPDAPGADVAALAARVAHAIRGTIGVHVRVDVRPPGTVPRSEGKAVRVLDLRAQ
jgi:phenylacetate-CoA ligase